MKEILMNQGLEVEATYSQRELEEVFYPILNKFIDLRKQKGEHVLIYLVAPPGAGKTTLSLLLKKIFQTIKSPYSFQSLPMDGFHHTNDYLLRHFKEINETRRPLKDFKGIPDTFDLDGLKQALKALKSEKVVEWPIYSRKLHDRAHEKLTVEADILLVEGNYLLLNQEGWKDLKAYADYTIRMSAPVDVLKDRIIQRKIQGGYLESDAIAYYQEVDLPNHYLVMKKSMEADIDLVLNEQAEWAIK